MTMRTVTIVLAVWALVPISYSYGNTSLPYPSREVDRPLTLARGTWQWQCGVFGSFNAPDGDGYEIFRDYRLYPYPPLPTYAVTDRFEVGVLRAAYALKTGDTERDGSLGPGDHAFSLQVAMPGMGYGTDGVFLVLTCALNAKYVLNERMWLGLRLQEELEGNRSYLVYSNTVAGCAAGWQFNDRTFLEGELGIRIHRWGQGYLDKYDHDFRPSEWPYAGVRAGRTLNERWSMEAYGGLFVPAHGEYGKGRLAVQGLVVYTR